MESVAVHLRNLAFSFFIMPTYHQLTYNIVKKGVIPRVRFAARNTAFLQR